MKKLLFAALLTITISSGAFAVPEKKVNYRILSAFENNYPSASNVVWDLGPNHAKAIFLHNNIKTEAFYNLDGDFIGTSKGITPDHLPTEVKRSFARKYAAYTVKEAIQFDTIEETTYYMSVENEQHSIILKVVGGSIEVIKKNSKN